MLHQVGVGALGPVFRTYEPTRDRLVAVKVFRLDITPEQATSLAHELSLAADAGLFHPSIVEPIAAGVEGTVAYRAEEYVAAESLDVAMRHYAPAAIQKALPFLTQLAGAIDFARAAGVGHGALHPRDIFVTPDEARATGFGVVEALERVGLRAPVRRPYSAPERVSSSKWSTPADVFSLAAIAFELLTGRRPAGTGRAIGELSGSSLGRYEADVHAVLARAMDDEPSSRYPTALAFASALGAAARGETAPEPAGVAAIAPVAAAIPADVIEEQAAELPAPVALGDPEPAFDDIAAEHEEDEAHFAVAREEEETGRFGDLAEPDEPDDNDEALEDLALEPAAERFTDDFSADAIGNAARQEDLFDGEERDSQNAGDRDAYGHLRKVLLPAGAAAAAGTVAREPVRPPASTSTSYGSLLEPASEPPPRSSSVPIALAAILFLLMGLGAGYALWGRDSGPAQAPTQDAPPPAAGGQAYSEQAIPPARPQPQPGLPPAEPPSVPGDAPPPASTAAKPPAAAATTGRLVIRSTPSRANVTVDGKWRGRTPLTLDKMTFGNHDVRVVQAGYAVSRQQVSISQTAPSRTMNIRLERTRTAARPPAVAGRGTPAPVPAAPARMTGSIYVDSRPRGARVFLDGKQIGVTPLQMPDVRIGSHVVRLELEDHRTWTSSASVAAGQQTRVTGSLERIR